MHMHKCEYTFINVNPTGRLQSHGGRGRVTSRAGGSVEATRTGVMSQPSEPGDSRANSEAAGERGRADAGTRRLHLRDAAPPAGAAQPPRRGHQPCSSCMALNSSYATCGTHALPSAFIDSVLHLGKVIPASRSESPSFLGRTGD